MGPQAGAGGLPRRLRAGRPQDALQAGDGRARRARRHPALHPHRHRQLQLQDRAALRGPRPHHHRRDDRRGRRAPVQQPVGLVAQRGVRPAARRPRPRPQRAARADPAGDRAPPGRPAGADPDEDELAGRRARDRRAVRRLVGGCAGPADHPRDLRAAPRRTRPLGVDRGPVDPGPVPRAQPGLLVRQRRRAGGVDRVRGHDAPQPGPADRGAGAAAGGRAGRGGGRAARPVVRPGHGRVGAAQRRRLGAQRRPGPVPGDAHRAAAEAAYAAEPP